MKSILIFLVVILNSMQLLAQQPKLVVGIVVDQMRWDYLKKFQHRYGNDGFNRLMKNGYSCNNTYLNYIPSYTAPGHASIFTGTVPAIHGIVGNDWIEHKTPKYCCNDTAVKSIGTTNLAGQMSPKNLKTTTIGDELKLSNNLQSKVFGIALKDRGAVLPAGHLGNGAFWFDDQTGKFISSSFYYNELPYWLQQFNESGIIDSHKNTAWNTLYPIASYTLSLSDDNEYEYALSGESRPIFPHNTNPLSYKSIKQTPSGNTLTVELAKALIRNEKLGRGVFTDMINISFSSSDYIGHAFTPNSIEVEDMYLRLDQDIANLLEFLDNEIGKNNYTVFLTADHGGAHNAAYLNDIKIPAGVLSEKILEENLNAYLFDTFNVKDIILEIMNYQIYLNHEVIKQNKISKNEINNTIIDYCQRQEGISRTFLYNDLIQIPQPLQDWIINGYYPKRCGDLGIIYEPGWYSNGVKGTTHGTWNPYDTHIPLIWYGNKIPVGSSYKKANVTDIAATLAYILNIQVPNGCIGNVCIPLN
jgi:predicted AlkP superfamily pyrophosphatase or phosphodiesterase